MSDAFTPTVATAPEFVSGETPTAAKLTVIGALLKRSATLLERVIGDAHDANWPYTPANDKRLSFPWGLSSTGAPLGDIDGRPLDIVNLSRLIGPASNLNPHDFPGAHEIVEFIPDGVHEFELRFPPVASVPLNFTFGTAVYTTLRASANLLGSPGDYYVDFDAGRVYSYSPSIVGEQVQYDYNSTLHFGTKNSPYHTYNVIPDPNQITAGGLGCSVTGTGPFTVVTPFATHSSVNAALSSTTLDLSDPNFSGSAHAARLQLPLQLAAYPSGTEIPAGFLVLKDMTTNEIYDEAVYNYVNSTTVEVSNADLAAGIAGGHDYCLLTVGTDITSSIDHLRLKGQHTHNRDFGEPGVHYSAITGHLGVDTGLKGWYSPSSIPGNFAPQYLHRNGYATSDQGTADKNVMRGDVVLGLTGSDPGKYQSSTPGARDSYGLYLGEYGNANRLYADFDDQVRLEANTGNKLFVTHYDGIVRVRGDGLELAAVDGHLEIEGALNGAASGDNDVRINLPDAANNGRFLVYSDTSLTSPDRPGFANIIHDTSVLGANGSVLCIENGTTVQDNDACLELNFSGMVAGFDNYYVECVSDSVRRGGLRGTNQGGAGVLQEELSAFTILPDSGTKVYVNNLTVDGDTYVSTILNANDVGNVQFFSGGADFGEWVECGDHTEWFDLSDDEIQALEDRDISLPLGLPEGLIVWVRDRKFWQDGTGTPMVVTNRAIVAGNVRESGGRFGEMLSFVGQVPVIVDGPCADGDLLLPVDGENHCKAVKPADITLVQYIKVVGTAWGTDPEDGLKKITCAIGIK